jgi:hypothetical protein
MGIERRRAPRYQLIAEAEIVEPRSRQRYKARTSDVSLLGCFLNTSNSLPAGTAIQLRVTHQNGIFTANGKVARSEPAMGIGISFDHVKKNERATLQQWLLDLGRSEQTSKNSQTEKQKNLN